MTGHLDPALIEPGDIIMGTLPVSLVAELNARGARYFHLVLDLPAEAQGREQSADDMEEFGAKLCEYTATKVENG